VLLLSSLLSLTVANCGLPVTSLAIVSHLDLLDLVCWLHVTLCGSFFRQILVSFRQTIVLIASPLHPRPLNQCIISTVLDVLDVFWPMYWVADLLITHWVIYFFGFWFEQMYNNFNMHVEQKFHSKTSKR